MDLKEFEFKRILKDVRYWKEEYELKKDMAYSLETMFNDALEEFLIKNPLIKEKWDAFIENKSKQIEKLIKQKYDTSEKESAPEETEIEFTLEPEEKKEPTPKQIELKRLYREIVKLTHPDKLHNHSDGDKERRIKLYKDSTVYYNNEDLSNLIYCADELGLKYDTSLIDIDIVKKDIELFKQKAIMYEKSVYWKWYNEKDETILTTFLSQQMSF
jgi:hypothetical protein